MDWYVSLMLVAVIAVSLSYPQFIGDLIAGLLMAPVLCYTILFFIEWDNPSLLQWVTSTGLATLIGIVLFFALLPICAEHPKQYTRQSIQGLNCLLRDRGVYPVLLCNSLFIIYEELIWRVFLMAAVPQIIPMTLAIPFAALMFWYVHAENRNWSASSCEFLLFSLAITLTYVLSGSVLIAFVVHLTRNLLILSHSYTSDLQEVDAH